MSRVGSGNSCQTAASHAHLAGGPGLGISSQQSLISIPTRKQVEWWQRLHAKNLVTVHTAQQLRRVLQRVRKPILHSLILSYSQHPSGLVCLRSRVFGLNEEFPARTGPRPRHDPARRRRVLRAALPSV